MPRIRPYESQVSAQGDFPTQGADAADTSGPGAVNLGQAVQNAGQNMGVVQRIVENNATRAAVTDVHTMLAGAKAEYTKQALDFESKADPKDTDLWDQFYHGNNPEDPKEGSLKWYLDSYRSQITNPTAQQAFDRGAADLTSQFGIHFAQVQSRMAGVHAKNQAVKMIDSAQATVQSDPSQYQNVMTATMKAIDDPRSDYSRAGVEQRNAIKQMATGQIASSTVRGMIGDSPQHALHSLQAGEWDDKITGEQKIALIGAAETQIRGVEADARRKEADLVKKKKDHSDTLDSMLAEQEILSHTRGSNTNPVGWKDILAASNSGLDSDKVKSWISKMEERAGRSNSGEVKTDIATKLNLFKRMGLGFDNPNRMTSTDPIDQAYLNKKLSDSDHDWLTRKFLDSKSPDGDKLASDFRDFYKRVPEQPILKPGAFGVYADATKGAWYDKYINDVERMKQEYIKAGKNPRDLIDPRKPDYVGTKEFIDPYANPSFGAWPDLAAATVSSAQTGGMVVKNPDRSQWNPRTDGTAKGDGFFGVLKRPDGKVSSELSTSDPIDKSGKEVLHPLIVPTLTRPELDYLLSDRKDNKAMESRIYEKAATHARDRIKAGKSPFAGPGEQQSPPRRSLDELYKGTK